MKENDRTVKSDMTTNNNNNNKESIKKKRRRNYTRAQTKNKQNKASQTT